MPTKTSPILEPLLKSSALPEYAEQLNAYLEEERRKREAYYDWITEDDKAEFIFGEIIVQSPAKKRHTDASANLTSLLRTYVDENSLGFVGSETVLVAFTRNDYLPDIVYYGPQSAARLTDDQMKFPPPDLIVEVLSPSTEEKDRTTKFDDYEDHGVSEYWLVDPKERFVEQYILRDGNYQLLSKMQRGSIISEVVEGFEIPIEAIFDSKAKNRTLAAMLST